jgi:hypothetical protein
LSTQTFLVQARPKFATPEQVSSHAPLHRRTGTEAFRVFEGLKKTGEVINVPGGAAHAFLSTLPTSPPGNL